MRLLTYRAADGGSAVGVLGRDGVAAVAECMQLAEAKGDFSSLRKILSEKDGLERLQLAIALAVKRGWNGYKKVEELSLLAPIPDPEKIVGVAANYHDACQKSNAPIPKVPRAFAKFPTAVNSPGGKVDLCGHEVTYEGELGVVIGRRCRKAKADAAMAYIAGYTAVNDFSAADCARIDGHLLRCKSHDGFLPMGPILATSDEIDNPGDLGILTTLNGEVVQDSRTSQLIVDIPHLIEYFSSFLTLVPGDIIATGTPAGTATHFDPPKFMRPGDVVAVTVEKIGTLTSVMAEGEQ